MRDLSSYRKDYLKDMLNDSNIPSNPFILFNIWFKDLEKSLDTNEINTMVLNTVGNDGFPKGRVVLLKYFSEEGFVFFTNYRSEKGLSITNNNKVSITFFWKDYERQVIIKGKAEKTDEKLNKTYFKTRPFESKVATHVSKNQSSLIGSREIIDRKFANLSLKFKNRDVPKPEYWGGYIVRPIEYEFWQGRKSRLHDRIRYSYNNSEWESYRLSP
tara:strand:- start:49 stop:693 length:645 start_codon:yes stop_codon:yes gene_type:complete